MKIALAVALLMATVLPSFAELTQQDLDKISVLIDRKLEPIKKEITAIKLDIAEMRGEIKAVRAEMKTLESKMATKDDIITLQRELTKKIEESNARVNSRIDSMYYQMWAIWTVIFVTILAAIFGGPIFAEWWRKKQERKDEINKMKEKAREIIKEHPEFTEVLRTIGLI